MSSDDFSTIISEASVDPRTGQRLEELLRDAKEHHSLLSVEHFLHDIPPIRVEKLARVLSALEEHNLATKIVRVESPSGGGIQDFKNIEEIPDDLHDWRTDQELHVQPENIKVFYKF
jgi:hypothetical protein